MQGIPLTDLFLPPLFMNGHESSYILDCYQHMYIQLELLREKKKYTQKIKPTTN